MSLLLVVMNAGALCVAHTEICAPKDSTLGGRIDDTGGTVKITPAAPMKALGAEFPAGGSVVVTVVPDRGAARATGMVIRVRGELARESVISGATVAGTVEIEQVEGRPSTRQLVGASDLRKGRLQVFAAGTVDVSPGMQIEGRVDTDGGNLVIKSDKPFRGLGLDFAAGRLDVRQLPTWAFISGTLAKPQEIGGVLVEGRVEVAMGAGRVRFSRAQLSRTTPTETFGLPKGSAPAGTVLQNSMTPALEGPGPFTVCGLEIAPRQKATAVTFPRDRKHVVVRGTLGSAEIEIQPGLHLTGDIEATYDVGTCQLSAVEGILARNGAHAGIKLANGTFSLVTAGNDHILRGVLAGPHAVDGLTLVGEATLRIAPDGALHLISGTLAKPGPFEQWRLPTGSSVRRSSDDFWSFEVPRSGVATAIAPYRGEKVDRVKSASSGMHKTDFEITGPYRPRGSSLALEGIAIDHASGCVSGGVRSAQRSGIFAIPAGGAATVCGGTVVKAEGTYAVPTLQVGRWFGTHAIGSPSEAERPRDDDDRDVMTAIPTTPITGYWIQINSLCKAPAGIPTPPPPRRWLWVDLAGKATTDSARSDLASFAGKRGTPCPKTRCCVP